jgi:hypothetical protein
MLSMRLPSNAENAAGFPRVTAHQTLREIFRILFFSFGIHGIMKHVLFVINPEDYHASV